MIGGGSNPAKKSSWHYTIKAFPDSIVAASNGGVIMILKPVLWQRWQSVFIMYAPLKINIKPTNVALEDDFPVKLVIFRFHEKCSRVCDYRAIFKIGGFLGMSTQFYQVCVP